LLFLKLFQMSPLSSYFMRVGEQGCSIKHGMTLLQYWQNGFIGHIWPAGQSSENPDVDSEKGCDSTHPCWCPTPMVKSCDLTLPTQTYDKNYNDLTWSNRQLSTLYSCHTPQEVFHQEPDHMLSLRLTKEVQTYLVYSQDFLKIFWGVKV